MKTRKFIREMIDDENGTPVRVYPPDMKVLSRPSMQTWAGYRDTDECRFLGGGTRGRAYLIPGPKVLKITSDPTEAEACASIQGRRLSNVVKVYRVAEVARTEPQQYAILQQYLPEDLSDDEREIIDVANIAFLTFAASHDVPVTGIDWSDRRVRHEFRSFLAREFPFFDGNDKAEDVIPALMKGLTALRRAGVTFGDLHPGNVRKNAQGRYTLFDLGTSQTNRHPGMGLIESQPASPPSSLE